MLIHQAGLAQAMSATAHSKLKLLSGMLDGVEFTLEPGDTLFLVGRARELGDSGAGAALSRADNVFYIPDDSSEATFRVRCSESGTPQALHLREHGQWAEQVLLLNAVMQVAGLDLAVRDRHEAWSDAVLDHRLPGRLQHDEMPATLPAAAAAPRRMPGMRAMLVLLVLSLMALGGWWLYESDRPAAQARELRAVLATAPYAYRVVTRADGADSTLYAFSDSSESVAWGQRASRRSGRTDDVHLRRGDEAQRLGQVLDAAGIAHAIVRMQQPQRPEAVIMSEGASDPARITRAAELLKANAPYAEQVDVLTVTDAALIATARAELRARGISTRVDPGSGRASVVNDVFLDDAALHAMSRYRDAFARQWGERRIRIRVRLWDDLLKGRSYQYSQDQLLSVGEGRWEFSNAGQH